jgi:four helix bundle protein
MLKSFKELAVWQKSYELCLEIYKLTKIFPDDEKYGLTSQMRRSAVSVPSNIAEGYGRKTTFEYIHSLYIAYGSICELETQILLSIDLDYITPGKAIEARDRLSEVERMIKALIKSLENKGIMDSKKMPREPLDPLNP